MQPYRASCPTFRQEVRTGCTCKSGRWRREPQPHGSRRHPLQAACLLVFIRGKRIATAVLVRPLYATLLFACIAHAACGHDAPVSPSSQSGVARAPVKLKVMTFNIQHGIDGKSHYDIQSAITAIARTQPDIVGLQEVTRNHPFYACDDQPARLADGLRAATGQNWDVTYQQEWFTPDVSCQTSGRGDGRETEGLAFLTRRGFGGSATTALPDTRIGLETTVRDAYGLPVVVTHLTSGRSASAMRQQQIDKLLAWTASFGAPIIVMGDFNAD